MVDVNIDKSIDDFMNVYGFDIREKVHQLRQQFKVMVAKSAAGYRKENDLQVNVVAGSTKIDIAAERMVNHYKLDISYMDMIMLSEQCDYDLFESFCKLVSHEWMHFLLGHVDKEVRKNCNSYIHTYLPYYTSSHDQRDLIFQCPDERNNMKLDIAMWNIVSDMVVNNLVGLDSPALRAKSFGLPEGLSERHYLSIIYNILNAFPEGAVQSKWFSSSGKKTYISEHYAMQAEGIKQLYLNCLDQMDGAHPDDNQDGQRQSGDAKALDDGLGDQMEGNMPKMVCLNDIVECKPVEYSIPDEVVDKQVQEMKMSNLQGNLPAAAKKMSVAERGIWGSFHRLLGDLERRQQHQKLSLVDRRDDWGKYNSRKSDDKSGLMHPGKREQIGAVERKMQQNSVLFVDISASMMSMLSPLFTFCWFALKRLNMEVVFYDTEVKLVVSSASNLKLEPFVCGGTNCLNACEQWERMKNRKLSRVVVLSDCYDDTLAEVQKRYNAEVWKMSSGSLNKWEGV